MVSDFAGKTYLDYAASTPVDERVLQAMLPHFSGNFGNPSSSHAFGQQAEAAIEAARRQIADIMACHPDEILFTSGGTESNNLAIRGAALAMQSEQGRNHILISPVEHPAALATARQLADYFGFDVELVPVDEYGRVNPVGISNRLRPSTALVSIIHASNEVGTLNPIAEIGTICRSANVLFHTDSLQAAAHFPIRPESMNVDLLSIGGHKLYGPKGIGALYVRSGTPLVPIQTGGSHEFGLRAGTSNTPLIVGLAEALRITAAEVHGNEADLSLLRDRLVSSILERIPGSMLTGHPDERLPNHASFAFRNVRGNDLLMILDSQGFACSSGSACKTGNPEPSQILLAMGLTPEWALGSLRVTLGRGTTGEQIDRLIGILPTAVESCRHLERVT